MGLMEY